MKETDELIDILDVETIGSDVFRGRSPQVGWQRVFGGLVIAQSLVAAMRTVEQRLPHSLHAYFLLPGDPSTPIVYEVERIRDGRSFATRRCVALQGDRRIFSLSASFHTSETGFEHSAAMPPAPPPEDLETIQDVAARLSPEAKQALARFFGKDRPFDIKPVDPSRYFGAPAGQIPPSGQAFWMKSLRRLPDDPRLHRAVLAYLSDMTLLDAALVAHGRTVFDPRLQVASLDHALWFHRDFRIDEWLLYVQDSPSAQGARAFARGLLFSRAGALVASVCQEGLIRRVDKRVG
jgi:acyl-CoA thioesterase-2